jgi:hypothetical protein
MNTLARRVPAAVPLRQAAAWTAGVLAAQDAWVGDFGDEQFTLGRAWYTHYEQKKTDLYFADAAASDARVETYCPGLQSAMIALVEQVTGERALRRPGYCGPGVHVFPIGERVARRGGDVHFDIEGLTPEHLAARTPAITLIVMLSPPQHGGELRVWDVCYEGSHLPPRDFLKRHSEELPYTAGDLVVIDSYRLHRIQPFRGDRDRITSTCHAVRENDAWQVWF